MKCGFNFPSPDLIDNLDLGHMWHFFLAHRNLAQFHGVNGLPLLLFSYSHLLLATRKKKQRGCEEYRHGLIEKNDELNPKVHTHSFFFLMIRNLVLSWHGKMCWYD